MICRNSLYEKEIFLLETQSSNQRERHSRAAKSGIIDAYPSSCGSSSRCVDHSETPETKQQQRKEKLLSSYKGRPAQTGGLCCLECLENTWHHLLFSQEQSSPPALCHAGCPKENLGATWMSSTNLRCTPWIYLSSKPMWALGWGMEYIHKSWKLISFILFPCCLAECSRTLIALISDLLFESI